MDGILKIVTDKLVELMFDHKTGWSADPPREAAVEANQILRPAAARLVLACLRRPAQHQIFHRRSVRPEGSQRHPPQRLHADARQEHDHQSPRRHRRQHRRSLQRAEERPALLPHHRPGRSGVRVPAGALPGRRRLRRLVPGQPQLRVRQRPQVVRQTVPRSPRR